MTPIPTRLKTTEVLPQCKYTLATASKHVAADLWHLIGNVRVPCLSGPTPFFFVNHITVKTKSSGWLKLRNSSWGGGKEAEETRSEKPRPHPPGHAHRATPTRAPASRRRRLLSSPLILPPLALERCRWRFGAEPCTRSHGAHLGLQILSPSGQPFVRPDSPPTHLTGWVVELHNLGANQKWEDAWDRLWEGKDTKTVKRGSRRHLLAETRQARQSEEARCFRSRGAHVGALGRCEEEATGGAGRVRGACWRRVGSGRLRPHRARDVGRTSRQRNFAAPRAALPGGAGSEHARRRVPGRGRRPGAGVGGAESGCLLGGLAGVGRGSRRWSASLVFLEFCINRAANNSI